MVGWGGARVGVCRESTWEKGTQRQESKCRPSYLSITHLPMSLSMTPVSQGALRDAGLIPVPSSPAAPGSPVTQARVRWGPQLPGRARGVMVRTGDGEEQGLRR